MAQAPMDNRPLPSGRDKTPLGNRVLPGKDKTPLGSRMLPGKDKTPLGSRVLPGKDKTPLGNRVLPAKPPAKDAKEREAEVDQSLLLLLRSLNLAIAQVSQARELRYDKPGAAIPPGVVDSTLQHLHDAQQLAEALKRSLG
jgi:hypothetical protein